MSTHLRPAASGLASHTDREPTQRAKLSTDGSRGPREAALTWLGDASVALLLVGMLWYWEGHDGGRALRPLTLVAAMGVLSVPALVTEVRRLPIVGRVLLAAWGLGLAVVLATAMDRSYFLQPTLTYGLVPLVFLATSRVWRRPWGPAFLFGLLLAATGKYWHRSFLQWWGHAMWGRDPQWLSLSWWNQSAVLMAMFGSMFLGVALTARRLVAMGAGLAASACLAGAWLTGSRGGVLVTFLTVALVWLLAMRTRRVSGAPNWQGTGILTLIVLATGALVLLLTGMTDSQGQPLAQRDQDAGDNAIARLEHMRAAAGMFMDRPTVGHGPGSYRELAPGFTSSDAVLTSQAHNQYLQVLAEGGLVFGVPFLAAILIVSWMTLRVLRKPPMRPGGVNEFRAPVVLGGIGMLGTLVIHSVVDFDWAFPILPVLGAISAAVLWRETGTDEDRSSLMSSFILLPFVAVLAFAGMVATDFLTASASADRLSPNELAVRGPAWDAQAQARYAQTLVLDGHVEAARTAVERGLRWSPGNDRLRVADVVVAHGEERRTTTELVASVSEPPDWLIGYVDVARYLASRDEIVAATDVAERGLEVMREHRAWGNARIAADAHVLLVRLAGTDGGCSEARQRVSDARDDPLIMDMQGVDEVLHTVLENFCSPAREESSAQG